MALRKFLILRNARRACLEGRTTAMQPILSQPRRSFLRHPGLAQTDEISGFEQGTDLRHSVISGSAHAGDARKRTFAAQLAGFGEFGSGAFGLALEGIGGGEEAAKLR